MGSRSSLGALVALAALVGAGCSSTKEAASAPASGERGKVLVIVSSRSAITLRENKSHPTGYFFNELVVPVRALVDDGWEVVFANPDGNAPSMDPASLSAEFFGGDVKRFEAYRAFHEGLSDLKAPRKLSTVVAGGLEGFDGVFFPGGHAPMEDLCKDRSVAAVLNHFHEAGKPTAAICHGPIALVSTAKDPDALLAALERNEAGPAARAAEGWPYAGYRMTVFSTVEEKQAEAKSLGGDVRFYADEALRTAGGVVEVAAPNRSQVVHDRELITGQNPASDEALARTLLEALAERRAGAK